MSYDTTDSASWKRYRDKYRSISPCSGQIRKGALSSAGGGGGGGEQGVAKQLNTPRAESTIATPMTTSLLSDPALRRHLAQAMRVPLDGVDKAVDRRARGLEVT